MAVDYDALKTWQTTDLLFRDSRLVNKTRVMGMSETEAIIHIVTLVCTAGSSLPINLLFCIWHGHRYDKVKRERTLIHQILGTRNMAYQGRGRWVNVDPNAAHHCNATPTGAHCEHATHNCNATGNGSQQDSSGNDTYQKLECISQLSSFCVAPQ